MRKFGRYAAACGVAISLMAVLGYVVRADVPQVPTGTWMAAGRFGEIPRDAASAVLADGTLVVTGGFDADGQPLDRIAIYDSATGTWRRGGLMAEPRAGHTATALKDGRVLITGGRTATGITLSAEIYDPAAGIVTVAGALSVPRADHAAARLLDNRVLIVGGTDGTSPLAIAEIFDPATGSTSPLAAFMSTPRVKHSATTLLDGHVLIAGGSDGTQDLASAEMFDDKLGTFFPTASLRAPRSGHLAMLLPHNNTVLITGGTSNGTALASVERYVDWYDGFVSDANAMATGRSSAVGIPTPRDGVVLVGGGASDAELYGFATLTADKDDYAPGEIVTFTGSGWQPGETVHLTVSEDADTHYDFEYSAVADEFGNIVNRDFYPREDDTYHHMGMRFYTQARGIASEAQTTFTDAGTLTITFLGNGSGSVSGTGAGQKDFDNCISANRTCSVKYTASGEPVLTATAASGSTFAGWSSNVDCSDPKKGCVIKMDGDKSITATFTISSKRDQTITFGSIANKTYGDADFVVTATASSPLPVSFTAAGQCTVTSGTVHIVAAGSCTIAAHQAGDANYNPAPDVSQSFTIAKATPVVSVTGGVFTYDGKPHAGSAAAILNGVNVTGTFSFTYNGDSAQPTNAGTYNVLVSFTSTDTNYANATGTGTITINKADATVTVTGTTVTYDGQAHGATGTAKGVGGAVLSGLDLGAKFTNVPGGTAHWSFTDATGNYTDKSGDVAIVISKADATVTVDGYTGVYDGEAHGATGTAKGVDGNGLAGLSLGASFTDVPGGTAHWTFAGGTNYADAAGAVAIVIKKASASVTANNKSRTYGQANPALDASVAGAINRDRLVYSLATTADQASKVGSYAIVVTLGDNPNYDVTAHDGTLTVGKAMASVTANDKSRTYGQANPDLDALVVGAVNGDTLAYSVATTADQTSGVGSYAITVTLGTNPNYDITAHDGSLTIGKATASVKANDKSKTYGQANPALDAVEGGTVNGDTLAYTLATAADQTSKVGSYAIVVTLGDNPNYEVTPHNGSLTIGKATASVTANDKSKTYGQANPALDAVIVGAVNGDTLAYSVATTADQTSGIGSYPIVVTLGSNPNYDVTPHDGSLTIGKATASVTANDKSKTYGQANPALDAAVTGTVNGDKLAYSLATSATEKSGVGSYPITVTLGTNPNYDTTVRDGSLTINQAKATVTANNKSKTYGDANPALDAVETGAVNGDKLAYSLATAATEKSGIGAYPITVSLATNPNYEVSRVDGTLTVTKASLTVKANDASRPYGVANPTFSGSYSGQKNGETFTISGSSVATPDSAVGTYAIVPSASGATIGNYEVRAINGTLTIGAWSLRGFYEPVGEPSSIVSAPAAQPPVSVATVWNTIKGGQTVPMKFNIYQAVGGAQVTTVADAFTGAGFSVYQLACSGGSTEDAIPSDLSTGATELRWDGTQFIQNWKTPKVSAADLCYRAVIMAKDGSTITAFFKVKK